MLDQLDSTRRVILKASAYTASSTFEVDGAIADPGSVAVAVTREDGSAVASGIASGTGAAPRTFPLTATHTALLDVLTITWTSTTLGVFTTQVEIVGGFVTAIGQINASLNRGGTSTTYDQAAKEQARTIATDAIERECRVAFSPRYASATLESCSTDLLLPTPMVTAVRSVMIDGQALDQDALALVAVDQNGLYRAAGWRAQPRGLRVAWEHGYRSPPGDVSRAVALLATSILADAPWDDRGMAVTGEGGMVRLLTAGVGGAAFSIPEVQAVVRRYRYPSFA